MKHKKKVAVAAAALAVLTITACSFDGYTDQSMRTLRYEKGASQGGAFKECIQPGEKIATNDQFYAYPVSQREDVWDTDNYVDSNGNGISEGAADNKDLVVSVDGVDMNVKMKVQFFLNTSCEPVTVNGKEYKGGTLQVFHELIGRTRSAWFNCDDDGCSYDGGWIWAMTNYISSPTTRLATAELNQYTPEELWQETDLWQKIGEDMTTQIQTAVDNTMETDLSFYERMRVIITKIDPDSEFKKLYRARQDADTKAETAEALKAARIAEAKADAAVAEERAKERLAEINGFKGNVDAYNDWLMIQKGMNPRQPTVSSLITE